GIGKTTMDRIFEAAADGETTAWEIITGPSAYKSLLTPSTWKRILVYTELLGSIASECEGLNAWDAAMHIATTTGIMKDLKYGQTPEEISRYENLQELLNAIREFTDSAENNGEESGLSAYLESVALLTDRDTEKEEDRNKVTLMTMHSAKGLEFMHVYIAGLEENLFPSVMSLSEERGIEEERRLFYVAVTRAKEQATLSYARNRYKWGKLENCDPSRFLSEIDDDYLEFPSAGGRDNARRGNAVRSNTGRKGSRDNFYGTGRSGVSEKRTVQRRDPGHNFKKVGSSVNRERTGQEAAAVGDLVEGAKVYHDRFGGGVIRQIDGDPPNTTAVVDFDKSGEKKLLLRFARLKLNGG
nr:ATP-binding domain-containing protein [Spirochaetales bacterium]